MKTQLTEGFVSIEQISQLHVVVSNVDVQVQIDKFQIGFAFLLVPLAFEQSISYDIGCKWKTVHSSVWKDRFWIGQSFVLLQVK